MFMAGVVEQKLKNRWIIMFINYKHIYMCDTILDIVQKFAFCDMKKARSRDIYILRVNMYISLPQITQ